MKKKPDEIDPRHDPVRKVIQDLWQRHNDGLACPWSAWTSKNLDRLLKGNKTWTAEHFIRCVRNWFDSENVNTQEAPQWWIPKLTNYSGRPLDKWGKPIPERPAMQKVVTEEEAADIRASLVIDRNAKLKSEYKEAVRQSVKMRSMLSASEFLNKKGWKLKSRL